MLLVAPSSAGAVELVNPDGTRAEPYQTWANSIHIRIPDASAIVTDDVRECGLAVPVAGCFTGTTIVVDKRMPPTARQRVFLHELGHWYDDQYLDQQDELRYCRLIGHRGCVWDWTTDPSLDAKTIPASEYFADDFELVARFGTFANYRAASGANSIYGAYGRAPSGKTWRRIGRLIRAARHDTNQ